MQLKFSGTGTSSGVPAIACDCSVCTPDDLCSNRRHCSIAVSIGGTILSDKPWYSREQSLTFNGRSVDAVLISHTYADHFFGLDDMRVEPIEVLGGAGFCTEFVLRKAEKSIGYFPDCSSMLENTIRKLQG